MATKLDYAMSVDTEFAKASIGMREEIPLFRELIKILNKPEHNIRAAAAEIHGNPYQVRFEPADCNPKRETFQCELGDILLVNFNRPLVRLTVLQAKVAACQHRFYSPLTQWGLLAMRPEISSVNPKKSIPRALLSGATLPAIGSYGYFYPRGGSLGGWDYDHIQAGNLAPKKAIRTISKNYRSFSRVESSVKVHEAGYTTLLNSHSLNPFAQALYNCEVGSPLDGWDDTWHWMAAALVTAIRINGLSRNDPFFQMTNEVFMNMDRPLLENSGQEDWVFPKLIAIVESGHPYR